MCNGYKCLIQLIIFALCYKIKIRLFTIEICKYLLENIDFELEVVQLSGVSVTFIIIGLGLIIYYK